MDVVAIDSSISSYQTTPKLKPPLFRLPSRTPPTSLTLYPSSIQPQDCSNKLLRFKIHHCCSKRQRLEIGLGQKGVLATEGVLNGGNFVGLEQVKGSMVNYMPKVLMVLKVLKEHGLILAALFGLSAIFFYG
ncbi:hypothetical protein Hanom_Chr00s000116g01622561 [Helianthus anomalus]